MSTADNEMVLSLRADIRAMVEEFKSFKVAMDPAAITALIATNFVAQFQSLEDRIVEKLSIKNKTPVKNTKVKSGNDDVEKVVPSKLLHCNYANMPHSSWTSTKIYFLQLKKLYPSHLEEIMPADIWKQANEHEDVVDINKKGSDHQKAKVFVNTVWGLGEKVSTIVFDILKKDLDKENAIRNAGELKHVSKEEESAEELSADVDESKSN